MRGTHNQVAIQTIADHNWYGGAAERALLPGDGDGGRPQGGRHHHLHLRRQRQVQGVRGGFTCECGEAIIGGSMFGKLQGCTVRLTGQIPGTGQRPVMTGRDSSR